MPSRANELPRSYAYKLAPEMNSGKRKALAAVHAEWVRTLPRAFHWYWQPFLRGGALPWKPACTGPKSTFPRTGLVTPQKQLMAVAIEGQASSWASNLRNRLSASIMRCNMLAKDTALRRELLWLNSMRAWLVPYRAQLKMLTAQPTKAGQLTELSVQASRIMRRMTRRYIELHRLPDLMQLPMQVNQMSARWGAAQATKSHWAKHWLRVSTLTRRSMIALPVMGHNYADARSGRLALTFSLVPRGDDWYAIATKYIEQTPWQERRVEILGIDLGLRNLIATSEGDVRGSGFLAELQRRDAQLQQIQQGLQQAGHRRLSQCRRYRLFVQRLRGWLRTTMQTHLAALLEQHRPRKVVAEDLLFAGEPGVLSRRMNRLLRSFGQRHFAQTLEQRSQEFGFEVEYVEPAYSSQTCASCGFVHRNNRRADSFNCLACGRRAHADVNAAKNLARRSSQEAHPQPVGRHHWRVRSLQQWADRLRSTLQKESSGSPRHVRAARCARAGHAALIHKQGAANRLPSVEASMLHKLLNRLSTVPA